MEPHEAQEQHHHLEETAHAFGRTAALMVAVLAAILAIATVSANNAMTHTILDQGKASDTYAEYQANSFKKHINTNDAALLRLLSSGPNRAPALALATELDRAVKTKYGPNQARLLPQAQELERSRDRSEDRHRILEFAEASLQLAIVLTSAAVVVGIAALLWVAGAVGLLGALLTLDGLLVVVKLPS